MEETVRVYKFLAPRWALEVVQRERLKIATIGDINDPFEGSPLTGRNRRERTALLRARAALFKDKGLISFSRTWQNPVLWSHYADNHRGIALGFDVPRKFIFDVLYVQRRTPAKEFIRADGSLDPRMGTYFVTTKFSHWAYEDEVRMFVKLNDDPDPVSGLHFKAFGEDIRLREIVLGPQYASRRAHAWQKQLEVNGVDVLSSRLAFQDFAVVEQKSKSLKKSL